MRPLRRLPAFALPLAASLAACATPRPAPPAPIAAAAAVPAPAVTGYADLVVPSRLADGGYATPNRLVSATGALWHLRAGLNVAALTCRGDDVPALVAGYNALIVGHRAEFDATYRALGKEHGGGARFDDAMTRLYNYYALPPARAGLCRAALAVLGEAAAVPAGRLDAFAPAALARLDAPYVAVFAQQDAWRAARFVAGAPPTIAQASGAPILAVDPAVFLTP